MIINPVIPIWLMAVICIFMLLMKRKGLLPYIRQIIIILLIFTINLRIMVPSGEVDGKVKKIDASVLFVVDNTISMIAKDGPDNMERLEQFRNDVDDIMKDIGGARMSIISFDNNTKQLCPFTTDAQFIKSMMSSIYPLDDMYARGTNISSCREEVLKVLKENYEKTGESTYLFFVSDGEITDNYKLESFSEMAPYVKGGAVLGYGTEKGGQMYIKNKYTGDETLLKDYDSKTGEQVALSKIDENNLKTIAEDIGIKYISMNTQKNEINSVVKKIMNNGVSEESIEDRTRGKKDIYFYFAIPLVLLLGYDFLMYRRIR